MGLKIKICGITNADDAMAAIAAGADALGFMFYEQSPRNVSIPSVAKIARALPPFVSLVGVFVDPTEELIAEAQVECGLDALQFHGHEGSGRDLRNHADQRGTPRFDSQERRNGRAQSDGTGPRHADAPAERPGKGARRYDNRRRSAARHAIVVGLGGAQDSGRVVDF